MRVLGHREFLDYAHDAEMLAEMGVVDPPDSRFLFDRPGYIVLEHDDVCTVFARLDDDEYDVHLLVPRNRRGTRGLNACKAMLDWVFTSRGATAITGQIRRNRLSVRMFACALGFQRVGEAADYYLYRMEKSPCLG